MKLVLNTFRSSSPVECQSDPVGKNPKRTKCLLPDFSRQPVDAKWLERLLGKLTLSLQHLDWEVLAAKPFLATKQFSLADLMDSKS